MKTAIDLLRDPPRGLAIGGCLGATALWCVIHLVIFRDLVLPLTFVLPLLICFWARSVRMLWGMAAVFVVMASTKVFAVMPQQVLPTAPDWMAFASHLINIVVAALVIHGLLKLRASLETRNQALAQAKLTLETSNRELRARDDEINQQNEELAAQNEELVQQAEELRSQREETAQQAEELRVKTEALGDNTAQLEAANAELRRREDMVHVLLQAVAGGSEQEILHHVCSRGLELMGESVAGAAVLEPARELLKVLTFVGKLDDSILRSKWPLHRSLAHIIMRENRTACLEDMSLRPEMIIPQPITGVFRSMLASPLRVGGIPVGAIEFYSVEARQWTSDEFRLAEWVAGQCSIILEIVRLKTSLQDSERQKTLLLEAERAARTEAEKVNRLKDEFLATVSHELRTPLNAVIGWSRLLAHGKAGEMRRALEIIDRSASTLNQLVEDLLDTNKIISGKIHLAPELTDLALLVHSSVRAVQPGAEAKGIGIQVSIDPQLGLVRCDPNRIQQVIWNLIMNVVKFTPPGGQVRVAVKQASAMVSIAVSDTGQGISAEFLPHVFERFRQYDGSVARRHGGLGLGLAIVKHLAEIHGGTVCAESDGPGKGATFVVTLPNTQSFVEMLETRKRPLSGVEEREAYAEAGAACAGLKVVLVDDDEDTRVLVTRVLREADVEVYCAISSETGFRLAAEVKPDVLISDIGMPGEDGYQFIRRIRSDETWGASLPCIALSALARPEDREKALASGYDRHVSKPFDPHSLLAIVGFYGAARKQGQSVSSISSGQHDRDRKLSILVVEDDPASAEMLRLLFHKSGYAVLVAGTVERAVDIARRTRVDLVITDLLLDDGNGRELMETVRSFRPVPGILISGRSDALSAAELQGAGFEAYLVKPIDLEELLQQVRKLFPQTKKSGPARVISRSAAFAGEDSA